MTLALSATSLLGLCQAMRCLGSTHACSHAHDISPTLEDQLVLELEAWRAIVEPDGVLLDPMEGAQQLASGNGEAVRPGVHPGLIPVNGMLGSQSNYLANKPPNLMTIPAKGLTLAKTNHRL